MNMPDNKRIAVIRSNNKSEKTTFKYVFILFGLSNICEKYDIKVINSNILLRVCNKCNKLINVIMYMCFCLMCLSSMLTREYDLKKTIIASIMDFVSVVHHVCLCKNFKKLKNLVSIVSDHASSNLNKPILVGTCICVWSLITNSLFLFMLFSDLNTDEVTERFYFWFKCENAFFRYFCIFFYLFCSGIIIYMPFNTFTIYYDMLCYELRNKINEYKTMFKAVIDIDYEALNEMYSSISSKVRTVDSEVGVFVFISFLFNALMMDNILRFAIHSSDNYLAVYRILHIIFCAVTLVNFAVQLF